jgi:hypothetical protein
MRQGVRLCLPVRFHVHLPHCSCGPFGLLREHAPARRLRLCSTAKPYYSINLLDTFESTFGRTLGRLHTARCSKRETNSYASYTRKRVHSFQLQGSALTPLPMSAAKPDADFSLQIERCPTDVPLPPPGVSEAHRAPHSHAR